MYMCSVLYMALEQTFTNVMHSCALYMSINEHLYRAVYGSRENIYTCIVLCEALKHKSTHLMHCLSL